MKTTISVLGTEYSIVETSKNEDKRLCDCDGFCDKSSKEIVITTETDDSELANWTWYRNKVLRHEIMHAFFFESGMQENFECKPFGIMETLVDWLAIQYPKIKSVFDELGI